MAMDLIDVFDLVSEPLELLIQVVKDTCQDDNCRVGTLELIIDRLEREIDIAK